MDNKKELNVDGIRCVVAWSDYNEDCVHWLDVQDGAPRALWLIDNVLEKQGITEEDFAEEGEEKIHAAYIYNICVQWDLPGEPVLNYACVYIEEDDGSYCYFVKNGHYYEITKESRKKLEQLPREVAREIPESFYM